MLDPFFTPRGVAVVGASTDPHKLGYGVVRNLVDHHYPGPVYPINPIAREILGYRCYPRVADVPDPVDLAIVIVPALAVAGVVEECGKRGIRHAVVVSGGFAETGDYGLRREKELAAVGRKFGMRIIGPNCIGTIDTHTPLNTTFVIGMPQPGDIGFLSQSGALVAAVIDWARGIAVGFSRIVSLGNQADVTETEMLSAFAGDPQTKVITAYVEGLSNGRKFIDVARDVARRKAVIVLKAGHGESGAKAVASHTGALAGSMEAYDAAFRLSGVLRAHTMEELVDWARALAWQPLPAGKRVAVLTNAGGPGILAVDALVAAGLELAPLTDETRKFLRPRIPAAGSLDNPVDILAGSGPGTYAVALDAMLSDPTVDAALVIQAPQDWFLPTSLAEVVGEVASAHHKPVLTSIMGLASVDKALEILHQKRIPNFAYPERGASALAAMVARRHWLDAPESREERSETINRAAAAAAIASGNWSDALSACGIHVAETVHAHTAEEAANAAARLGYPVALKLSSPDVTHKSDYGGVILNLASPDDVARGFQTILGRAKSARPDARIDGVVVQKMIPDGIDLIVGARSDPQFGHVIVVGGGGTDVELLRDIATGIAPLSASEAEQVLARTKVSVRIDGWRGSARADRSAAISAMVRLSELVYNFPQISELEVNPLRLMSDGNGAVALDVRGTLAP
jgi:acetyltransferase